MPIRLTPSARLDLLAIRKYGVDRWGDARAREFLEGLISAIERLERRPAVGRPRDEFLAGLRSFLHRDYVIFYIIQAPDLRVIGVLHQRRNVAALNFADMMEDDV